MTVNKKILITVAAVVVGGGIVLTTTTQPVVQPLPANSVALVIDGQSVSDVQKMLNENQGKQIYYVISEESSLSVKRFLYGEAKKNANLHGKIVQSGLSAEQKQNELNEVIK